MRVPVLLSEGAVMGLRGPEVALMAFEAVRVVFVDGVLRIRVSQAVFDTDDAPLDDPVPVEDGTDLRVQERAGICAGPVSLQVVPGVAC